MKVSKIKNSFQKIELNIIIETEEELCDLYHRLNANATIIEKSTNPLKYGPSNILNKELFNILSDYVNILDLK